jgi:hypothetical protein
MDKNTYTHTRAEWESIISKLRTSWPEINWPSGSIQRSAECIAANVSDVLHNYASDQPGISYRVDDDDYDSKAALQIAGA